MADRRAWSTREKALLACALVCLIAAIAGFALYAQARVPDDAAAKFNDTFVDERTVAQTISEQRVRYGLENDSDFASYLLRQGQNVTTYRQSIINQVALNMLIDQRAAELGATPSEEDVDAQIEAMKGQYAIDGKSWDDVLVDQGVSEESLRDQLRTNLAEQAMYAADVKTPEPTDDDVRDYVAAYRAGGVDKHSWRATFTGDDAKKRAQAFRDEVLALGDGLNAESFSALAKERSDSPTVDDDGGDAGWIHVDGTTSYAQVLADMEVGDVSQVIETETQGNYGVAYCDDAYEYADVQSADEVDISAMPESLLDSVRESTAQGLYRNACATYLTALLTDAKVTYYPIPDGAVYNVDMKLAQMASGDYLDEG